MLLKDFYFLRGVGVSLFYTAEKYLHISDYFLPLGDRICHAVWRLQTIYAIWRFKIFHAAWRFKTIWCCLGDLRLVHAFILSGSPVWFSLQRLRLVGFSVLIGDFLLFCQTLHRPESQRRRGGAPHWMVRLSTTLLAVCVCLGNVHHIEW